MNSVFSFNKYHTIFSSFLAAGFYPKNLAFPRKITALPEAGGGLQPPAPLACMPINKAIKSIKAIIIITIIIIIH